MGQIRHWSATTTHALYSRPMRLNMICAANGIEHRPTKPNRLWTNGQDERMNRVIEAATMKRFYVETHDPLRTDLAA
jgi:hypothetical protein